MRVGPKCAARHPPPECRGLHCTSTPGPSLCPPPHPHRPLGVSPCQRQTSWVTPLQKGPLLTDAYQLACWAPSTVSPPAFLSPIRALVGSATSRPLGEGWGGSPLARPPLGSWLTHPLSPLLSPEESQDHRLVLCRGLAPTGRLKHAAPRFGCESEWGVGTERKLGSPAALSLGGFPCHLPLLGVAATRVPISVL